MIRRHSLPLKQYQPLVTALLTNRLPLHLQLPLGLALNLQLMMLGIVETGGGRIVETGGVVETGRGRAVGSQTVTGSQTVGSQTVTGSHPVGSQTVTGSNPVRSMTGSHSMSVIGSHPMSVTGSQPMVSPAVRRRSMGGTMSLKSSFVGRMCRLAVLPLAVPVALPKLLPLLPPHLPLPSLRVLLLTSLIVRLFLSVSFLIDLPLSLGMFLADLSPVHSRQVGPSRLFRLRFEILLLTRRSLSPHPPLHARHTATGPLNIRSGSPLINRSRSRS